MLTEGKWAGGNGMIKKSSGRKKPNSPPPSPTPKKLPAIFDDDHICTGDGCVKCMHKIESAEYYGDMAKEEALLNGNDEG
jgi:hypothetical protein